MRKTLTKRLKNPHSLPRESVVRRFLLTSYASTPTLSSQYQWMQYANFMARKALHRKTGFSGGYQGLASNYKMAWRMAGILKFRYRIGSQGSIPRSRRNCMMI